MRVLLKSVTGVCCTYLFAGTAKIEHLLLSVEDVTDKVLAERKTRATLQRLRTSEMRFRELAERSGFGLVIYDAKGGLSYLNSNLLAVLGYSGEELAAGLVPSNEITPAEFAKVDAEGLRQLMVTGKCAPYEKAYYARDGRRVPVLIAASLLEPADGREEFAALVLDLTGRKRSEQDAFLLRLDDETRSLLSANKIMETAARLLSEHLLVDRCAYADVEDDQETFIPAAGHTRVGGETKPRVSARYTLSMFGGEASLLMRANAAYVIEDAESDSRTSEVRAIFRTGWNSGTNPGSIAQSQPFDSRDGHLSAVAPAMATRRSGTGEAGSVPLLGGD